MNDQGHLASDQSLREQVKKLQYENTSAQNLSNALKEEMKELTKQLASLKKENLALKAERAAVRQDSSSTGPAIDSSNNEASRSVTGTADSKLSGQSKTNQYCLCSSPNTYVSYISWNDWSLFLSISFHLPRNYCWLE